MIDVEVGPAQPRGLGHPCRISDARASPPCLSARRRSPVRPRAARRPPRSPLVRCLRFPDRFPARGDSRRPRERRVQRDPLDDRPLHHVGSEAHRLVACDDPKGVAEVADHLVSRHPSPAAVALRSHLPQSQKELSLVAWSSQGFHVVSLLGARQARQARS